MTTRSGYLFDTNIVSHLMRKHPAVMSKIAAVPVGALCISVITEAELKYGVAKRPTPARATAVREFLARVEVVPWTSDAAAHYGPLRAQLEGAGTMLAPLDLLIAAQALCGDRILVTADKEFSRVPGLEVEDWTS
jgi:tRNA(fMet)-specific endonuclease VapC